MYNGHHMFEQELLRLDQLQLRRKLVTVESAQGPRVMVNNRSMISLCSNDYLGLSNHPKLREAARVAMDRYGFGTGASRLVSGNTVLHEELEKRIAAFKGAEAAILFNSGYAANTGIIPALAKEGDAIFSDSLNHASIIDGCRLSKALVCVYRHRDMDHLETLLKEGQAAWRRLVVTDGVFSMDGDIAPLPDIVSLAEQYDAIIMVDEAHATGVLGKNGRGTMEHFNLHGKVHIQMGTLGKALGSFGAYVAGDKDVIEYLLNTCRSYIFSTSLPPAVCAASIAAIDIVDAEPVWREKLWNNRNRLVVGLEAQGIGIGKSETPIMPIIIGDNEKTLKAGKRLFDEGVFATAIRPPTVAEGSARIRTTVMATYSDADIDTVLEVFGRLKQEGLL